jgi:hypothetical protein
VSEVSAGDGFEGWTCVPSEWVVRAQEAFGVLPDAVRAKPDIVNGLTEIVKRYWSDVDMLKDDTPRKARGFRGRDVETAIEQIIALRKTIARIPTQSVGLVDGENVAAVQVWKGHVMILPDRTLHTSEERVEVLKYLLSLAYRLNSMLPSRRPSSGPKPNVWRSVLEDKTADCLAAGGIRLTCHYRGRNGGMLAQTLLVMLEAVGIRAPASDSLLRTLRRLCDRQKHIVNGSMPPLPLRPRPYPTRRKSPRR